MIPTGYTLAFAEEFDAPLSISNWGSSPLSRWMAHTPYAGDFGDAWFTGPYETGVRSPFSIANSYLYIRASKDPVTRHWRSGLISSVDTHGNGFSLALGYWECRMKCPTGAGVWPAFWLNGITSCNRARTTNSVEIDVLEAYGVNMQIAHQNVHVWDPSGKQVGGAAHVQHYNLTNRAHVFGCLVTATEITFTIDGYVIWTTPTPPEALEPLYCMVNLALGGGWPITETPDPSYLEVDYVRAYKMEAV